MQIERCIMLVGKICDYNLHMAKAPIPLPKSTHFTGGYNRCVEQTIGNVEFLDDFMLRLKEPKNLLDGIEDILNALKRQTRKYAIASRLDAAKRLSMFQNRKLEEIVGFGANTLAIKLDNNEVLGISNNNPFVGRAFQPFDLPVITQGRVPNNSMHYSLRKFAEEVDYKELEELEKNIQAKGFKVFDWGEYQAGKSDGKIYLLDFECAKKK